MKNTRPDLVSLGVTAVAAWLLTIIVRNFVSGEKKIRRRIPRKYNIADSAFERSMS